MSNTLDLSRVVFAPGRIESDHNRNRKWAGARRLISLGVLDNPPRRLFNTIGPGGLLQIFLS